MFRCNKCYTGFVMPDIKQGAYPSRQKTVCPHCGTGDIVQYGAKMTDKYRMIDYIFDNLPDINSANIALHSALKGEGTTRLDPVVADMEEMLNELMGTTSYMLSVPFDSVTDKSIADDLACEAKDYIERGIQV